ncbi:MAG: hypothetical protein M4579_001215 [Chaenotheca gracillima]|nr:MAG: hypothetical protein M4579_001215 [Chaenotheca gracillima]
MSSRALRKAQRQREELAQAQQAQDEEEVGSSEEESQSQPQSKASLFAMLNEDNEDEQDGKTSGSSEHEPESDVHQEQQSLKQPSQRKRKKKKKVKASPRDATKSASPQVGGQKASSGESEKLDEIDVALRSLASTNISSEDKTGDAPLRADPAVQALCSLLSIDSQHLNASNEMRRLFGRAALERDPEEAGAGGGRRRGGQGPQQAGIAGVLSANNAPGGKGLTGLSLRRNIFIQGKEEWPRGLSGGLGMEIVEKRDDGIVEYRMVHTFAYQDVQRQFESCRESMDPERMVQLLYFNPYHISTLLQVSEICKHEHDHSTAGDLLERCLFSFGRAVHSSFAGSVAKGKARFSFRRPENREFFLAGWRYLQNLGMRGTWRTAFEWAKLLLSLDPVSDPYSILSIIDQLALRARQPSFVTSLATTSLLPTSSLPNIQISLALAKFQLKEPDASRRALFNALNTYPYVFTKLFQALGIERLPPSIWGLSAPSTHLQILSELYSTSAKDLWATPEATSLLVEIAGIPTSPLSVPAISDASDQDVPLSLARHIILTESQPLIALLPHSLTTRSPSSTDPLPPDDDLPSYTATDSSSSRGGASRATAELSGAEWQELQGLQEFFRGLAGNARPNADGPLMLELPPGMPATELDARMRRMQQLMVRMGVPEDQLLHRHEDDIDQDEENDEQHIRASDEDA